jgi:hypothetical protein
LSVRFWCRVDKRGPDECWPWLGCKHKSGYGRISAGGYGGRMLDTHRVSWELHNGPIPEGEGYHGTCVLHRCDNRPCCNPNHLFLGTNDDNMADMVAKGRAHSLRGEANGNSKLTAAQVAEIRSATGAQSRIAARFGISQALVSKIRRGENWQPKETQQECRPWK